MGIGQRILAAVGINRQAHVGFNRGGHEAGRLDVPELDGWIPGGSWPDDEFNDRGERTVNRIRDLESNNGWISGAIDRRAEAVVGNNIRLSPIPVHDLIGTDGQTYDWRVAFSRKWAAMFRVWAHDVSHRNDARRQLTFGQQVNLAYIHYARDGEVAAEIRMDDRGARFRTNVRLVDADRIENPHGQPNSKTLQNGIVLDRNGAPVAYWVRNQHRDDSTPGMDKFSWTRIAARTPSGKPKFIHVARARRVDQLRGFSSLIEAVVPAKMLDKVDRAEVNAAMLSAMMTHFIKAPGSTSDIYDALQAPSGDSTTDWKDQVAAYVDQRKKTPIHMKIARVFHLLPDEDVITPDRNSPNANYPFFIKAILQKIAASTGISYAQISQNWEDLNYSSARAMLNEMWRSFLQDREFFCQQFCTPINDALMEEAVATGQLEIPGGPFNFYVYRTELTMSDWIGPGRGTVDPQKESNSANLEVAAGRRSTAELVREQGRDLDEILLEEKDYLDRRRALGLDPVDLNTKGQAAASEGSGSGGEGSGADQDRDNDGIVNEGQPDEEQVQE